MNTLTRRRFIRIGSGSLLGGALLSAGEAAGAGEELPLATDRLPGTGAFPATLAVRLGPGLRRALEEGRLGWRDASGSEAARDGASGLRPVQAVAGPAQDGSCRLALWLSNDRPRPTRIRLQAAPGRIPANLQAGREAVSGQFELTEAGRPVLRYNYHPVKPAPAYVQSVSPGNRKYAVARSDYLHPLHGLHGEELTFDWSRDHPHHRGIYWAWPEVDWRGQRGDLHALQQVFARPTGKCLTAAGPLFAQVDAENLWHWQDGSPIVRERALIRAWKSAPAGRLVDLTFRFSALKEPVLLARRHTDLYGGLNVRLNRVRDQKIVKHTDAAQATPRRAWGEVAGTFGDAKQPSGLVILQHAANPDYPGDWVDYPELNWLQPTFPAAKTRWRLEPGRPLTLRYRLWIHPGPAATDAACAAAWDAANAPGSPLSQGGAAVG